MLFKHRLIPKSHLSAIFIRYDINPATKPFGKWQLVFKSKIIHDLTVHNFNDALFKLLASYHHSVGCDPSKSHTLSV